MPEYLLIQAEYLLRLVLALLCGGMIGYERQKSFKETGIRTHIIVSLSAAMMIMISKYGFFDVIVLEGVRLDPSRIASTVVTAIGFLGAGVIFLRRQSVMGLTTAAGLWATVGIGMAMGAGMYFLGAAAVTLILLTQGLLRQNIGPLRFYHAEYDLLFQLEDTPEAIPTLQAFCAERRLRLVRFRVSRTEDNLLLIDAHIRFPNAYNPWELIELLQQAPWVKSVEY